MADGPVTKETLMELVTRLDAIAFLKREPDGATSRQIAHALRSVGLDTDVAAVSTLLGCMRRDGLVMGSEVALGGKRGTVTTWTLRTTPEPRRRRKLRMITHARRPANALHRHNCAHETACVTEVADFEPAAAACECPRDCQHKAEVPAHVRVALAAPRRAPDFHSGNDEVGR